MMNQNTNNNFAYNFVYNSVPTQIYGTLRQLWSDHIYWARANLLRKTENLPDANQISARLLKNIDDITFYIQQFYGIDKAREFEVLLQNHLLLSSRMVNNLFEGNVDAIIEDRMKSEENTEASARFLTSINPYYQYEVLVNLFREHDRLHEQEARYWIEGNYSAEIETFDQLINQGLQLSDYMIYGILQQFGLVNP